MSATAATLNLQATAAEQTMLPASIVGFFFSFRLFIILLTVRVFQAEAQTGTALGLGLNYLLLLGVVFVSFGPAPTTLRSTLRSPSFRWVLVFIGFSFCSLFWTAAVSVSAAFAFWTAMAADTAIVVLLLRTAPEQRVAASLMKGYISGAVAISAIAWILPAQSDLRLGDEELLGPNQIGYVCAFAVFLAQYLIAKGNRQWKFSAVFLAVTLLRTFSKTTIVAFLVGQIFLIVRDKAIGRRKKMYLAFGTCVVLATFWPLISAYYEVYTNAGNQAETLTGRIGIWAFILDKALDQPWIGHGFHSVWKVIPSFGPFEARHAHNEILQQFYAYGAAGIAMLIGLYGSFFRQMRRIPSGPMKTLSLGLLVFALIRGLADTEVFDVSLPLWMIALLGITTMRTEFSREVTQ
jgi:O-antigen ligase